MSHPSRQSIATRHGDVGTTGLLFGPRVSKTHARIEAAGALDELGSQLGLCRFHADDDPLAERLEAIQRELFVVGAVVASEPEGRAKLATPLTEAHVARLDAEVAETEATPGLLDDWALPGATLVGAHLDIARTVARRAERQVVALVEAGDERHPHLLPYCNRLSDLLWLYARWYELRQGRAAQGALRD